MGMEAAQTIVDLIGNTPMVRLRRVTAGFRPKIYAKLEFLNPGGSIKDRIALSMVLDAETKGLIRPGCTLVEPTSGNTGMGLAIVALARGYKTIFTVPDKMSRDKVDLLRALGAKVKVTPSNVSPDDPRGYVQLARRITKETPNAYMLNQYENPANPKAHYETTGPEIWRQTNGNVDVLVAGVGTGGTITGTARFLKEKNPDVKVVGVDPEGSILASAFRGASFTARPYKLEGIGEDFVPSTLDFGVIDEFVTVGDKEAFLMARRLATEEGILAGGSSGAAVHATLQVAENFGNDTAMVVILPDTGRTYLGKVYSDDWMAEQRYLRARGRRLAVSDILNSKTKSLRTVIAAEPRESLSGAIGKMTKYDLSQLPVVSGGVMVGSVAVASMVREISRRRSAKGIKVGDVMDPPLPTVEKSASILDPGSLLRERNALVVVEGGKVVGIITAIDVINYLARR